MCNTAKNIQNLCSLWETVGRAFNGFQIAARQRTSLVPGADWPNRIWFSQEPQASDLIAARQQMRESAISISISYWPQQARANSAFEELGFEQKSTQIGMSLHLEKPDTAPQRLTFLRVEQADDAERWARVYPLCFGYSIPAEILVKTKLTIDYYLVSYQGQDIGTAIAYYSGDCLGIHGLGVVPSMRKQGFAEEIMAHLLHSAYHAGKKIATLQASAMGKGIYRKMGFSEDFVLTNYGLAKNS